VLGRYLQATPDLEALAAQAEKFPDRWAQGLAIAGRLAGYTEKLEIEGLTDEEWAAFQEALAEL